MLWKGKSHYKIVYGNTQETNKSFLSEFLKKIPATIKILIPAATFYFGIVQYYYNQNLIDRRKYFNNYYDERFKVLVELAKATSKIHLVIETKETLDENDIDSINSQLFIFDYARLLLDKNSADSILLYDIEDYLNKVSEFQTNRISKDHLNIYESQKKILEDAGCIFSNEKDSINSFHFNFWPFGENKSSKH